MSTTMPNGSVDVRIANADPITAAAGVKVSVTETTLIQNSGLTDSVAAIIIN